MERLVTTPAAVTIDTANPEQAAAWNGHEGEHWATHADRFERIDSTIWRRLLERDLIGRVDRVLDVGCGTGGSTRELGRVAVDGHVLGVDLSAPMLAVARARTAAEELTNVDFVQADAQIHPFDPGGYDVVVSCFGAMFFADPVAAFANIASGLRADGTLALLAWRELDCNEWITVIRAALAMNRDLPVPPPEAPTPFSLADPVRVRLILGDRERPEDFPVGKDDSRVIGTSERIADTHRRHGSSRSGNRIQECVGTSPDSRAREPGLVDGQERRDRIGIGVCPQHRGKSIGRSPVDLLTHRGAEVVEGVAEVLGDDLHMRLHRRRIGMHLHDADRGALLVEVDVERDEPWLVLLDDFDQLAQARLGLVELPLLDRVRPDVDERTCHAVFLLLLLRTGRFHAMVNRRQAGVIRAQYGNLGFGRPRHGRVAVSFRSAMGGGGTPVRWRHPCQGWSLLPTPGRPPRR